MKDADIWLHLIGRDFPLHRPSLGIITSKQMTSPTEARR